VRTLCIDIGGTEVKTMVVDAAGRVTSPRVRLDTPRPATPSALLATLAAAGSAAGEFERVSVGFPGVVVGGVVHTAPNLDGEWAGFPLASELRHTLHRPVRIANDAGVQGLGVIEGAGTEVVLTLGTGMGFALFVDGTYVPNIELAHHPFGKGDKTYEQRVGEPARRKIGTRRWRRRVSQVVDQLTPIFNPRRIYLGGGNARLLDPTAFPDHVAIVDNAAGLLGGVRLWEPTWQSAVSGQRSAFDIEIES
jgi:polyphosphate glucokinase